MSLSRIFLFFSAIAVLFLLFPALSDASEPSGETKKPVLMDLMSPG